MKKRFGTLAITTALVSGLAISLIGCGKIVDSSPAPGAKTSVGTDIDDSVITSSVKSALLADADIKSFDFKVETRKGEVQLSGFVDSQAQLDRATAAARAVSGVKTVHNNVALKGTTTTIGEKLDDGIMTSKIKADLINDLTVKSLDIAVVTRQGEVLLSGFVDSKAQMDKAIAIARAVEGVRSVNNEMTLKK